MCQKIFFYKKWQFRFFEPPSQILLKQLEKNRTENCRKNIKSVEKKKKSSKPLCFPYMKKISYFSFRYEKIMDVLLPFPCAGFIMLQRKIVLQRWSFYSQRLCYPHIISKNYFYLFLEDFAGISMSCRQMYVACTHLGGGPFEQLHELQLSHWWPYFVDILGMNQK